MEFSGVLTSVSKYNSGSNTYGPWSVQALTVKHGSEQWDIKVWGRPDFASAKGKYISLTEVEWGKGKNRAGDETKVLELKDGKGEVTVTERGTAPVEQPASKQTVGQPSYSKPTQAEYEAILAHAINFVTHQLFLAELGASEPKAVNQNAVAEIVKGYMVALAKGDFVPSPVKPVEEVDPKDIPF